MIVKQYIKDFENLGFGLFVHFGIYSILEAGEWVKYLRGVSDEEYYPLYKKFHPNKDWAINLAKTAREAGCKYVTLTTRHHDGYSLFDTCGLNEFDAPHGCGRDLVLEFVDACRSEGIIPFFYHTLWDWHEESYRTDFKAYLKYLRDSVEILCKNYGKIGGIWFDGMWESPDADWEEDALYATIRKYQPEAMIINNTGMNARGALGNIELDSVTFERGKPQPINFEDSPKYIASEMCEVIGDHWGYAREDLNFKAPSQIIRELVECRRYGSNMLLNIGPKADGSIRLIDAAVLKILGDWIGYYDEAIRRPKPTGIEIVGKAEDFVLQNGDDYYLFCFGLPMASDPNVALFEEAFYEDTFQFEPQVISVTWMDNDKEVQFEQKEGKLTVHTVPFEYGRNLVVRVAKIKTMRELSLVGTH